MTFAEDLAYLRDQAFSFTLDFNPHAVFHASVDEDCWPDGDKDLGDWLSPGDYEQAIATGRYVSARVYPAGSVGFYALYGQDVEALVARMAKACREDLRDYARQGLKSFAPVGARPETTR